MSEKTSPGASVRASSGWEQEGTGADASTFPRCWDLSSGNKKWIIQVPILASIVVSRGGHRAGWGCGLHTGPIDASLDPRVRTPRPEKQLIPIPVQMGKLRAQGATWRRSGSKSPGRAVGPSVLAPALLGCSLAMQPSLPPTAQLHPLHQYCPGARHQAAGNQCRPV